MLHPQLEKDCLIIGKFELCVLLLMRDANYPWFILVPERDDIREIYELSADDQTQLCKESARLAKILAAGFKADKMNIAMLGNIVPQLHIHHIVRYQNDVAWPAPVWGKVPTKAYSDNEIKLLLEKLKQWFQSEFTFII